MASKVTLTKFDSIWVICIDRTDVRNAVDLEVSNLLHDYFLAFDRSEEARVAIVHGNGGNFCSGADLKAIASEKMLKLRPDGPGPLGPTRMQLSKPVIAAVEGYAVAGGLELALWADIRIASESAVFGVFCRRFGVPLIDGGSFRLPRMIGHSRAMDMILSGRAVDARLALDWGLVSRVVATGEALTHARQLAEELAAFPQQCMRSDRLSVYRQWGMSDEQAIRSEWDTSQPALKNEARAGAQQFQSGAGRHGKY